MSTSIDRGNSATTPAAGPTASISSSSAVAAGNVSAASATATMTVAPAIPQTQTSNETVLRLTLRDRPSVTWDEGVINNEGLGRKSSKRCCIFHKPRAFGESSTDTSDYDSDNGGDNKKIARKKIPGKKKMPDHLRFHA